MSAAPESGGAKTPKNVEAELDLLKGLLAQQQEAQQAQQREIAQQALEQRVAQARAATPAPAVAAAAPAPRAEPRASTVRSKLIAAERRKDTAVIRGETVDKAAIGIMRYGAIVLLAVSFLGSVVALNGGWAPITEAWPRPWQGVNLLAAVVGVGLQAWLTMIQWHKRHNKLSLLYITHLTIDATLTFLGFYPILVPFFAGGFTKIGLSTSEAQYAAFALTAVLALILAKIPEEMLVDG
jgi:hypothetical protein